MLSVEGFVYGAFDDVVVRKADYSVNCPFCLERYGKDDTSHKLQISIEGNVCHCWRCEYSATWAGLVMDMTGCSYMNAMAKLYITPKPILDNIPELWSDATSTAPNLREKRSSLPEAYKALNALNIDDCAELRAVKKYLQNRGFRSAIWKRYGLGWVPGSWRVYIPIENDFWQARAIMPYMQPKYMSPDVPASSVLFNSRALDVYDEIVVTEGAFSAMAVGDNAVALVGKNPTPQKTARLKASQAHKIIITLEERAWSILELADALTSAGKQVELWEYDNGKDPADRVAPKTSNYDFATKVRIALNST